MRSKILVVDDDPVALSLMEGILRNNGYDVSTAMDGLDALVQIKRDPPDVVVLDIMMPEINGYDVCFQLRFNEDFVRVPILLTTARAREMDPVIGDQVHIDYVSKPLDPDVFLEKIHRLLSLT
jgi:DNA-binding response OmpR family regulator